MSRWRPPGEPTTPYITAAGYRALEEEAKALIARRREVVVHLAAAAAEGDRSENAEYIYRKKELREIDRRLGYLQRRMPRLTVVREVPAVRDRVFFGARVTVELPSGESRCYRLVGGDEADAARGEISVDAPVAKALLKRALDDEVLLGGERCVVVDIEYPDPNL
ncbi:MAG: GreA/GreB family elongation factor [Gammaproteobacteria bacterium]|nr:GreA/GreB family elongation factor [Gammaproteobacteria bacterium]